jgi:tetratricopeptide (TPR) repeat protein
MGGAGKSTIAAAFAERVGQARIGRRRRTVWWVPSADPASLTSALVTVVQQLGGTRADIEAIGAGTADAPDRLWTLLQRAHRGWLLVFDNADDPSALARPARADVSTGTSAGADAGPIADGTGWMRPTRRGLVLVTSRNASQAAWGRHARVLPVGPLEEGDAAQVLLDWAPRAGDDTAARALAHRLGGLPLALHLAGSYLESDVALRTSFRDYQRALDGRGVRPRLLTARPDIGSTISARAVVMHTWEISLDALARNGVSQARPLLRLLSCYDPGTPIPFRLLTPKLLRGLFGADGEAGRALTEEDAEHRLEEGLHQLRLLGLIDVRPICDSGPPDRGVLIHPVIADTNRVHLADGADRAVDARLVRRTAIELVVCAIGRLDPDVSADWPMYLRLGPHLHALFQTAARDVECQNLRDLVTVTTTTAEAHHRCGAFPAGEHLSRAALDVVVPLLGDDDPASLLARHLCAWPLAIQGRLEEAEAIYRSVASGRRRILGDEHPDTLWTRHEVAWIAACQGRWAEAEAAYREVLGARRRILDDEHPHTLMTRHGLAWAIASQGRGKEAEPILRDVLNDRRRVLGEKHPRTLWTCHELAWVAATQGRWAEAEAAYREVLGARWRVLGGEHPDTLTARHELAWTMALQGKHAAAIDEYQEVLHARRRTLGENHPDTTASREALDRLRHGQTTPARHLP